jgi:mitochondrial fission protein ELM1
LKADAIPPRVWVVTGDKAGDNAQIDAVVERLPWPVDYRRLYFKRPFIKGKPPFLASLYHVDRSRSDSLAAPWPDAVITIGRRPAMAALWIRRQSKGHTRIILFGRPKRHLQHFALVVVSAQFRVAEAANVLNVSLPLMRIDQERLNREAVQWQTEFETFARPIIAVLVGGATQPFAFDAGDARELLLQARQYCAGTGSLYVTTSRRTPPAAVAALRSRLTERDHLYEWGNVANPYYGLLAHADGFVVTGDSMSMITEVARLNRPLAIYALRHAPAAQFMRRYLPTWLSRAPDYLKYHVLPRLGFTAYPRDLTEIHRWLYNAGIAVPAGQSFSSGTAAASDDLDRVVAAIVSACTVPAESCVQDERLTRR